MKVSTLTAMYCLSRQDARRRRTAYPNIHALDFTTAVRQRLPRYGRRSSKLR